MAHPKFGDRIVNVMASERNPRRFCIFVRVIFRAHSRLNGGTWYQCTDGKGDFWETPPENCKVEGFCEHGVIEGDWCEPCNKEYKAAAASQPATDR